MQRSLYKTGKVTRQVRLLQGQTVFQDDRKLSEYNIQDGAVISALFEPNLDVNIEVSTGHHVHHFTVSHSTSVLALKKQVSGVNPEKLDLRLGDTQLENNLPLHYYGIENGSKLTVVKPYVTVTVEDNYGSKIYKRIDRKDTINLVKMKLSRMSEPSSAEPGNMSYSVYSTDEDGLRVKSVIKHRNIADLRLYRVTAEEDYIELDDDDVTIEDYKLRDGEKLYLLSYNWIPEKDVLDVTSAKSGKNLEGVEIKDTLLGIKVRAQDQLGLPAEDIIVASKRNLSLITSQHKIWDKHPFIVGTQEDLIAEAESRERGRREENERKREVAARKEADRKAEEERKRAEMAEATRRVIWGRVGHEKPAPECKQQ